MTWLVWGALDRWFCLAMNRLSQPVGPAQPPTRKERVHPDSATVRVANPRGMRVHASTASGEAAYLLDDSGCMWTEGDGEGAAQAAPLGNSSISGHGFESWPLDDESARQEAERRRTLGYEVRVKPGGVRICRRVRGGRSSGGGRRGPIRGMSAKSRASLRERMAGVSIDACAAPSKRSTEGQSFFLTLTYHHEWPESGPAQYEQLKELYRRVRRAHGESGWLWVKAPQKRGAPHYHVIIVLEKAANKRTVRNQIERAWHEIAGYGSHHHKRRGADVQLVHVNGGSGRLRSYLLQYMNGQDRSELQGGLFEADKHEWGRRWGCLGDLPDETVGLFWIEDVSTWSEILGELKGKLPGNVYAERFECLWSGFLSGEGMAVVRIFTDRGLAVLDGCPF
jgi:hypothetical protein